MSLKTLDKALEVLNCFSSEKSSWGVRELSKKLDMNHTVVYRILTTFEEHGFLVKNISTNKYELGIKFLEYSLLIKEKLQYTNIFEPVMKKLSEDTGESVFLIWLNNLEGLCLLISESEQSVKYATTVGSRSPLYAGASGKVIMAYLPEEKQEEIIGKGLQAWTDNTITDPDELRADLAKIKHQGWCYSVGEYSPDVVGISMPVFNCRKQIVASLTVAAPSYRVQPKDVNNILEKLRQASSKVHHDIERYQLTFYIT